MSFTILNVAYPLAPVGPDAVGGAEQVVTQLDQGLVREGHRSLVVACEGSVTAGTLVPIPRVNGHFDEMTRLTAAEHCRRVIAQALSRWHIDIVHLHGIDCLNYLPPPGIPVLITLHLPPSWYPQQLFHAVRPHTFLHCVSASQRRACPPDARLLSDVPNGVPDELFSTRYAKRRFALSLGRICPEKGFHFALDAAAEADMPFLLGGQVFAYDAHESYFRSEILPRLSRSKRYLGPVGFRQKRRLLSSARCLLVPSLAPETSSLVAMEALACGTPVIAFPNGALPEIIEHGRTGFLVRNPHEMADAISAAGELNPDDCRASARGRFGVDKMLKEYFELYRTVLHLSDGEHHGRGLISNGACDDAMRQHPGGDHHRAVPSTER